MKEISIKKAMIYNAASKYGSMFIQFGITMILSRLISPKEYGVIALLLVLVNFLTLFSDMGLGIAVIQHPKMSKERLNQLFSFTILLGFILMILLSVLSYPISVIYENKEYLKLGPLISIVAFFNSLNVIPKSIQIRDKHFNIIAIRTLTSSLVSGLIAVLLASNGFGVYALVIHSIASSILVLLWNYFSNPLKPQRFTFKTVFSLMGSYSLFHLAYNIINYFTRNLDNLIIGAKFGSAALGYYDKAYTLNLYPNTIFTNVITGVLHPYIRDIDKDKILVMKKLNKILKVLSIIGAYVMVISFWASREIIIIVYGENWYESVRYFNMLALCIWAQMLGSVAGSFFLGLKRTDQILKCGIFNITIIVIAIILGILNNSVVMISFYVAIAYNLIFVFTYYMLVKKTLEQSFLKFFLSFKYELVFTILFIVLSALIPVKIENLYISLIVKVLISSATYILFIFITNQKNVVIDLIKNFKN